MGCNRNYGCQKLANTVYPNLKTEVGKDITKAKSEIEEIVNTLKGLSIPEDYLGEKISTRLNEICSDFNSDAGELDSTKASINSFIDTKIVEHNIHYQKWQSAMQGLVVLVDKMKMLRTSFPKVLTK